MINPQIMQYVESQIIPMYDNFDKAHDLHHVKKVIRDSIEIAEDYPVDPDMVYVIAAYHDVGLKDGRANHEKNSGISLQADKTLEKWFSKEAIQTMKEAVEDHRASNDYEPRSIYGKIVAEADRDISYPTILYRTIQYGLKNFPQYTQEEHFDRTYDHIRDKYGEDGYITLWLSTKKNVDGLTDLRRAIQSQERVRQDFEQIFADAQR